MTAPIFYLLDEERGRKGEGSQSESLGIPAQRKRIIPRNRLHFQIKTGITLDINLHF